MKKYLLFLTAAMLATVARAADGDTFSFEGLNYKVLSEADRTAEVAENDDSNIVGDIVIAPTVTYDGISYTVTSIGKNAFSDCYSLTSVSIPESVTSIGEGAFENCDNLYTFIISNYVTEIGSRAFRYCISLTSVTIPDSVISLGSYAFEGCYNMTSVNIGNSLTEISYSAFSGCSGLTSVSIPNSVTHIDTYAFSGCRRLASISIPESVTSIGDAAFESCGLTTLTIPDSVISLGECAFQDCLDLTSVKIGNSVSAIGRATFYCCSSLSTITIPSSVEFIDRSAFYDCTSLEKIVNLNPTPQGIGDYAFLDVPTDVVIYVPKGSKAAYMATDGWKRFSDFREIGAFEVALSADVLELAKGESAEIRATVTKDDDVTVESAEWSSSDPDVATVIEGVVTAVAPGTAVITYSVTDGYGIEHTAVCNVTVSGNSAVETIAADETQGIIDVYTLQGLLVLRNAASTDVNTLPAGLYIVRQGSTTKKIAVR